MKIDLAVVTIMKNEAPYVKEWIPLVLCNREK